MSATQWSIVLAKIDLVSLSFRLLWYHSILKGSIDQYNSLSRQYVACVKRGCSVSVSFIRVSSQISPRRFHVGRRKIQSSLSRENKIGLVPYPRAKKDRSNPHRMTCPPLPSSETQGQIKGARESLNGWKNVYVYVPHFPARLDFPSSPISAPGSPRMGIQMPLHGAKGYM